LAGGSGCRLLAGFAAWREILIGSLAQSREDANKKIQVKWNSHLDKKRASALQSSIRPCLAGDTVADPVFAGPEMAGQRPQKKWGYYS
jgi:hypothetical protein